MISYVKEAIVCLIEVISSSMPVIEISSLSHPGVEVFSTLTETQLRNRTEPGKGIFIVESPRLSRELWTPVMNL